MSIAVEKLKRSSARWYLVRLNPSRHITSLLVSGGGGLYSLNMPYAISSITRNGATLTETTSIPGSNDNWYHDESTGTLTIRLASAPSTTSNILILNYYIFLTTSEGQQTYETPTNSATPIRVWEPLVSDVASIKKTIPNAIFGVFTIDDFQLSLNNTHNDFQKYLTSNDSFKDSPALVWICANSNENISLVYTGKCQAPAVTSESISINIYDSFSKLNQPAYFGDTADEAFYYKTASSFPNMDPRSHGQACRLIIGDYSKYITKHGFPDISLFGSEILVGTTMFEAFCTNFNKNNTTSNNRTWGICRLLHDGSGNPAIRNLTWGTVAAEVSSGELTILTFATSVFLTMDIVVGDSVRLTQGAINHWGLIDKIDPIDLDFIDVFIRTDATTTPAFTTAVTITSYPAIALILSDETGVEHRPIYGKHYTVSYTTTSGGNRFASITFLNNFEGDAYFSGLTTLDPGKQKLYFRVRPNIAQIPRHKHGQVMKRIAQNAGIETVDSTFSDADTDLNVGVLMSVPSAQEFEYDNYLKYAEDVASSSLGFMFSNSEGKAEYHLLAAPTSTDVRTDDYILDRSLNMEINYQDIYTRIISYNLNDKSDAEGLTLSITSEENAVSRYLYNVNRPRQLVHVLDDFTGRIDYYLSVLSNPITTYNFETATIDIETDINDDLVLQTDFVPGGSVTVKVIGTIRDIDRTRILAITYGEL
jgi:hypothetical protein